MWMWGRKSSSSSTGNSNKEQQPQPLFGEYHEDAIQFMLALAGLALGKAWGLAWNMTPLPILGILGLSLWVTTRMLRYLMIFLFVVHATGVVVFTYRFIGMANITMALPVPGVDLTLVRFGMGVTLASILVGLASGLAVRSNGGYLTPFLRKMDLAGLVLTGYTVLLMIFEIALLKRPVPSQELVGVDSASDEEATEEMLYDPGLALFTSAVLVGISLFMKRVRIMQGRNSAVVISLAVGKAVAIYVDGQETESGMSQTDPRGTGVLCQALVGALLCAVMFAPRVFLEPVHVKNSIRQRRSLNGGPDLPPSAMRTILYAFIFLPITLVASIPYALSPLVNVLTDSYRSASFYTVSRPISELVGSSVCLGY